MKFYILAFVPILFFACRKAPLSCFSISPSLIDTTTEVVFDPSCSDGANVYVWNFGDGSRDSSLHERINVSHIYKKQGIFTITLDLIRKDGVVLFESRQHSSKTINVK